ncbi:hypothetical protein ACGFZP_31705 [Kitasatospora sp. NPDC048239]|uniref:hypothetical protein n=1 Tax=Kitasatospora sp. NPDC048239 TaxID=3364046 RepID=UPI0037104466
MIAPLSSGRQPAPEYAAPGGGGSPATAAPPSGDPDDQPPTPRHDRLATTAPRTVTFNSALSDHYPHITLQHWTAPPPPPLQQQVHGAARSTSTGRPCVEQAEIRQRRVDHS